MIEIINKYFIKNWDYHLSPDFLDILCSILKNDTSSEIKSFSIGDYCNGILNFDKEENGLYFFYFPDDSYYAGVAASCTLLERLSKHLDGRKYGSFNSVLKNLGKDPENSIHFTVNQQFFLEAKMLLLPVNKSKLQKPEAGFPNGKKAIHFLEEDIIYMMFRKGLKLKNSKIPKKYSGYFYNE